MFQLFEVSISRIFKSTLLLFLCWSGILLALAQTSLTLPHFTFIETLHQLHWLILEQIVGYCKACSDHSPNVGNGVERDRGSAKPGPCFRHFYYYNSISPKQNSYKITLIITIRFTLRIPILFFSEITRSLRCLMSTFNLFLHRMQNKNILEQD